MRVIFPSSYDLSIACNKKAIDGLIKNHGKKKDVNEIALTVFCQDGSFKYSIEQFHKDRQFVTLKAGW